MPRPPWLLALLCLTGPLSVPGAFALGGAEDRPSATENVPLVSTLSRLVPHLDPAATLTVTPDVIRIRFPAARRTVTLNLRVGQGQVQDAELGIVPLRVQRQGGQTLVRTVDLLNALGLRPAPSAVPGTVGYALPGRGATTYAQGVRQETQLAVARRTTLALPRTYDAGLKAHPGSAQYAFLFPAFRHDRYFRVDFMRRYAQYCQQQGRAVHCSWEAALPAQWTPLNTARDRAAAYMGATVSERGRRPTVAGPTDVFVRSNSVGTVYVHAGTLDAQGRERRQRTYVLERTEQRAFPVLSGAASD